MSTLLYEDLIEIWGEGGCLLSSLGNGEVERGSIAIIMIDDSECMEDSLNVHNDSMLPRVYDIPGYSYKTFLIYSLKFSEREIDNSGLPVQNVSKASLSHLSLT